MVRRGDGVESKGWGMSEGYRYISQFGETLSAATYLRHVYSGRRGLKLVQEKFKITDNNKLALPPLLNSARLRHLHVPLVRGPDAAGWVDTCNKKQFKNN